MLKLMKPAIIMPGLALLSILLFSCGDEDIILSPSGDTVVGPSLTINETSFEFGTAPQNSVISHTFWLYSRGTDTVKIISIQPG